MDQSRSMLEAYKAQLLQVEVAIANGQDDEDLLLLRNEMKELISLTEQSLVSYEKSKLITMVDGETQKNGVARSNENMDDEMARFYADLADDDSSTSGTYPQTDKSATAASQNVGQRQARISSAASSPVSNRAADDDDLANDEFLETIENHDDISGTRCQAPFGTEWSSAHYYNAMIMDVERADDDEGRARDDVRVRVLFLNPAVEQMKPCPYLLDGTCRFDADQCKFSHGHVVSLYDLRKFKEPDFANFAAGSTCLAKTTDALWCLARVEAVLEDHKYSVKFFHRNATAIVDVSDVFPCDEDAANSDSDESDVVVLDDGISSSSTARQKIDSSKFGAWEEHTRGFGSKIMLKLGYKPGAGLGKDGQGRVEPVPVVVLPAGKSLDHCMKLKEKKREAKAGAQEHAGASRRHRPPSVFHFLNKTLGDRKAAQDVTLNVTSTKKDSFGINECGVTSHRKKLSSQLLKNDTEMRRIKAKVAKLKESVARNRNKNPPVAKQLQVKLDQALQELSAVQSSSRAIEAHRTRSDTHRQMTKF